MLGDNSRMNIVMEKEGVRLKIEWHINVITRINIISNLKNNLLSIGQLQRKKLANYLQGGSIQYLS